MTTISQRPQRTNAGQTSKFANYSLVSFPQLKRHSIVKTALVNMDPFSPVGTQAGNIKAYGGKRDLMVIKTGTRQEMEEVSSRFSKEAGSEEIFLAERECEYEPLDHVRQLTFDDILDDADEYIPTTHSKKKSQPIARNEQKQTKRTTTTDALPLLSISDCDKDNEDDFNRILLNPSQSTTMKTVKRKNGEIDSSSLSASSDSDHEEDRWLKNKENLIRANVDLANLKKKKSKKKKQRTDSMTAQQSNNEYKSLCAEFKATVTEIDLIKKRLSKLEKVYSVVKKNTSFDQTKRASTSNTQVDITEDITKKVEEIFGVDPTTLKSPINRPTKVMRELYKNSGHDLSSWREFFDPNEPVLKDFIQQKCLILPEDIEHTWTTIINSMTQMPYDAVKYKQKSSISTVSTVTEPTNSLATATATATATTTTINEFALPSINDEHEKEPVQ